MDDASGTAERMLAEGASVIDVGGASSRPGSVEIPLEEERKRVIPVVKALHDRFPEAMISIDTWRAAIAGEAVDAGASMVNDISAGLMDLAMLRPWLPARTLCPDAHAGTPRKMQHAPFYKNVLAEVVKFLSERLHAARQAGIADVVIDPGFGFGKDRDHNYALLRGLPAIKQLGVPVLVGLSRKRMINEVLGTRPEEALNGTTVLNTLALLNGADILRVHDVRPAMEAVKLLEAWD
ncbi:MAG: dihydropteroate synthase [Flavobacteriales bacterium]|nr:dihydropteroate synthase [Flavobacteriales bacterium]